MSETHAAPPRDDTHLAYLERLLDGAVRPDEPNEFLYVTRTEGKAGFWELVAVRVPGLQRVLLGALHFQSQSDDPLVFARRSLGHFFSAPPQTLSFDRASYPADVLELRVPRQGESLPELLGALKRGESTTSLYLDVELVEVAFDFRPENPSLQRPTSQGGRTERLLFRSRAGHVVRASATNLAAKLRRAGGFVALVGVEQLVPDGAGDSGSSRWIPLPTMVVRRSFLTMLTEAPAEGAEASIPAPFSLPMAETSHLLDPRLSTDRRYGEP